MKKYFFILCILGITSNSFAQITISGNVIDKRGQPIPGVSISLAGTYDGGTSNAKGFYTFKTTEKGKQSLVASLITFVKNKVELEISGQNITQNFKLKEKISKLKAVRITAGAFEASDEKQGTSLKALDMVTTAGSNGDNYGAMKTLPGAQQTNEREGLFVRGGTGNETQTFIDGTRVRNAFSVAIPDLGARGRFNPFIFKGTIFSTGGYSALYGQALSSTVILSTIDLPEKSSGNFSLSSVGVGGGIQKLTKNKKQSYGINYNYLNLAPYFKAINQNVDFFQAPTGHQLDANYRAKTGKTGLFKFYGYLNNSKTGIRRQNLTSLDYDDASKEYKDEYGVKNLNAYANFSYKQFLNNKWQVKAGYSISSNTDDINTRILTQDNIPINDINFPTNSTSIDSRNLFTSTKVVFEHYMKKLNTIRFGVEYVYQKEDLDVSATNVPLKYNDHYKALFAETDIHISNEIAAKIGVRAEHNSIIDKINIAPRISAAYKINKGGQFSAAFGMFYQNPDVQFMYSPTGTTSNLTYQRADHYILNYLYQKNKRLLRLEVYNKDYHNLIKTNTINGTANSGKGYARGAELFFRDRKTFKRVDYWVSYSYIDSKRNFLGYPQQVQPDFVANHVGSIVLKKFWTKHMFGINGTYTYSSGRPYNDRNSNEFMAARTIDYHTIGVSLNYIKSIRKAFTVFVLSINNPFYFKQVYGYNYATADLNGDGQFARKEILPSARQFVFLGMFMSWGIDRSQEAINNNL